MSIIDLTATAAQRQTVASLLAQGYQADQFKSGRIRMVSGNSIQLIDEKGRIQRGEGARK